MKCSQALVRLLRQAGVEIIFGLCGDTSLPFYEALREAGPGLRHVLTRDERSAGYMADAYARFSSRVGVCEGPSGGGATYLAPGLIEANLSSSPLLAITTDIDQRLRGRGTLTEMDQAGLFGSLTTWSRVLTGAAELPDRKSVV
jgi:acetolactate synthase-1/2/3 large subunit